MKHNTLVLDEEKRKEEWSEIEALVLNFQKQFEDECEEKDIQYAKECGNILIAKFSPLFRKYILLFKTANIDFTDKEMKDFVALFIDDYELKKALYRKNVNTANRSEIYVKFNFIIETYGKVVESDMLSDLCTCLLILAKRYKNVGKSFCAYVYNSFKFELARHIKKFIENPLSVWYKNCQLEDWMESDGEKDDILKYEDNYYESLTGLPDFTWINGQSCSNLFNNLSVFQRKILIKYYLEDWNDRQIAEYLGIRINIVNQKRRDAINILSEQLGIDKSSVKRSRKSGRKASLPTI